MVLKNISNAKLFDKGKMYSICCPTLQLFNLSCKTKRTLQMRCLVRLLFSHRLQLYMSRVNCFSVNSSIYGFRSGEGAWISVSSTSLSFLHPVASPRRYQSVEAPWHWSLLPAKLSNIPQPLGEAQCCVQVPDMFPYCPLGICYNPAAKQVCPILTFVFLLETYLTSLSWVREILTSMLLQLYTAFLLSCWAGCLLISHRWINFFPQ